MSVNSESKSYSQESTVKRELKPNQRIAALEQFYGSSTSMSEVVVEEDLKVKRSSEEVRGMWILDQLISNAKTLGVLKFIMPVEEGGIEIPDIAPVEEYVKLFQTPREAAMARLRDSMEFTEMYVDSLAAKMREMSGDSGENRVRKMTREKSSMSASGEAEYAKVYNEWNTGNNQLIADNERLEGWINSDIRSGNKQYEADFDALKNAKVSMANLKKCVSKLVKKDKFSFVEETIRSVTLTGEDPYENGDMRGVYVNLAERYRKGDSMGILTSILAAMKCVQGASTVSTFMREVEDFHISMRRLKVEMISISDLSALIAVNGMSAKTRNEFITQESALELTLSNMNDSSDDDSDIDSTRSHRKERKSLYSRVKAYAKNDANMHIVSAKFRGQNLHDKNQESVAVTTAADNRRVYGITESNGACYSFARNGTCSFGDRCRYTHEMKSEIPKKLGVCFNFSKEGKCSREGCKFSHVEGKQKELIPVKKETEKAGPKTATENKVTKRVFYENIDEDERSLMVRVEEDDGLTHQTYVTSMSDANTVLAWDSGTCTNVAGDARVATMNIRPNTTGKVAVGVGGKSKIVAIADSELFGEPDFLILGSGGTENKVPNLLSVSKSTQARGKKPTETFIFTATGAVRICMTKDDYVKLAEITERAESEGRLTGSAELKNGLYEQSFGVITRNDNVSSDAKVNTVTSMYGGRVQLDSVNSLIGLLLSAGISEDALKRGVERGTLRGIPGALSIPAITKYMSTQGRDQSQLESSIATARLNKPIDYEKETSEVAGEIMEIDANDPSFSRGNLLKGKEIIRSIGGYRDVVIATDVATGYSDLEGRLTKKDPEKIISIFLKRWIMRWQALKIVKVDGEFVTEASRNVVENTAYEHMSTKIIIRQAVPGDHQRGLGQVEGKGRWLQEVAQGHMNRAMELVRDNTLSITEAKSFWYHAYRLALLASNIIPCNNNQNKSRYMEGTGEEFNLSYLPMLPFATMLIGKKLINDDRGRGEKGLYLGPSMLVRGGIIMFSLLTKSLSVKYSFIARDHMPILSDIDIQKGTELLYGSLMKTFEDLPQIVENTRIPAEIEEFDSEDGTEPKIVTKISVDNNISGEEVHTITAESANQIEQHLDKNERKIISEHEEENHNAEFTAKLLKRSQRKKRDFTIGSARRDDPYARTYLSTTENINKIEENVHLRPKKPAVPSRRAARSIQKWNDARQKEYKKFVEEDCFYTLPKDSNGKVILPKDAIVMKMLELLEYKWKPIDDSGKMGWLECVRAVCDGSDDKREGIFYAETPSKTVYLIMLSAAASLRHTSLSADAVRAYLNALSIDRNLVIVFPPDVENYGLERIMGINKGVYGTKGGALSWETYCDEKLVGELNFVKCSLAQSIYVKGEGVNTVRIFRHSDDMQVSGENKNNVLETCASISEKIKMSSWIIATLFLGYSLEYIDDCILVRQEERILLANDKYNYLFNTYNPKGRKRTAPLPHNALINEEDLADDMRELLPQDLHTVYRGIVGILNFIGSTRMDAKFSFHVVAGFSQAPNRWNMFTVIWFLEFIILTADWPLVLGGPVVDFEVMTDASFGIMKERKSIKANFGRTGPLSGAVCANVDTVRTAVTSVFEVEVMAASDGVDTLQYGLNILEDLRFKNQNSRRLRVDNEGSLEWFEGQKVSVRSRHFQLKYYHTKHSVEENLVHMEFVSGEENEADILTKVLGTKRYLKLARKILGHYLLLGRGVRGIIELSESNVQNQFDDFLH